MLRRADCLEAYEILSRARRRRHGDAASFERLLDTTRTRHGSRVDCILASIEGAEREAVLISRREKILDPDHRFFLALLLNVPDREAILSAIASTYGTNNPRGLVMQWLSELSGLDTLGIEIDDTNALLLRGLLAGWSFDATCDSLVADYSAGEVAAQRESLQEQYDRIRNHAPLRPLFNV